MMFISVKRILPLALTLTIAGLMPHTAKAAQAEKEPIPHIQKETTETSMKKVQELRQEAVQIGEFVDKDDWKTINTPVYDNMDKVSLPEEKVNDRLQHYIVDLQAVLNRAQKNKIDYEDQKKKEEEERKLAAKKAEATAVSDSKPSGNVSGQSFKSAGVIYQGGRRFTYYSSRVLYHYRTREWHAGSDGIYRTSDGYVVVAASDRPQGSIVSTPFGAGKVLDSGCSAGTTDIYVNF